MSIHTFYPFKSVSNEKKIHTYSEAHCLGMFLILSFSKYAFKAQIKLCNQHEVERILKKKEPEKNKKNCVFGLSKRNGRVFNLGCLSFIVTGKCMPFCKFNALE